MTAIAAWVRTLGVVAALLAPACVTAKLVFNVVPEQPAIGQPVVLHARWDPPVNNPNWAVKFQFLHPTTGVWTDLNETDAFGRPVRRSDGRYHVYTCPPEPCRLAVTLATPGPVRRQFRIAVLDRRRANAQWVFGNQTIQTVEWADRRRAPPPALVLTLTASGGTCEVRWTRPGQAQNRICRSPLDGPPVQNVARLRIQPDGSAPGTVATVTWQGFQATEWGWVVQIGYGGAVVARCRGEAVNCTYTIPAKQARTFAGESIGRDIVTAQLSWQEGTGSGSPTVAPPHGLGLSGAFGVELGIDYLRR